MLFSVYKKQIDEIKNKTWKIEDLMQKKIQIKDKFVWLNRTQEEINGKKKELFQDFGWTSVGDGNKIQFPVLLNTVDKKGNDTEVFYYLELGKYEAINNSSKIRGGNSFKGYKYIIWDEFMDEQNNYLPNEMERVKSILFTVNRSRRDVKWIFLSNTVSKNNTVFKELEFNPEILKKGQQAYDPETKRLFYYISANPNLQKEYDNSAFTTVFGKKDKYLKYRFDAEFVKDDDSFIVRELDSRYPLKPKFNVFYMNNLYGVYEYKRGLYFTENYIDENVAKTYPLTKADAVRLSMNFINVDRLSNWFFSLMKSDKIYFEDEMARETIINFITRNRN